MSTSRLLRLGTLCVALAVVMLLTAAILGTRDDGSGETTAPAGRSPAPSSSLIANPGDLSSTIAALQAQLAQLPTDYDAWSALGAAYTQQARVTGDPSYYAKAQGALRRSLKEKPKGNFAALTGEAALAAGRHEFGHALHLARLSQRINPYSSANLGMLVDALDELGRYHQATVTVQRMVDLKPDVPSYTRASYVFELKGNLRGASYAMRQAARIAYSPDDKAFALFQLGELAFNAGNLAAAGRYYHQARSLDLTYIPPLEGVAKVDAARGKDAKAVREYQHVVNVYPSPTYVIEYGDLLRSLGRFADARRQDQLVRAQEHLFLAAGVNLDLEQALYDANHGRPTQALVCARRAFKARKSVFVEDAYAWALHVNGLDKQALVHSLHAERIGTRSALLAFHRGMIEKSLGMTRAATASLRAALRINPYLSPLYAPEARAALTQLERHATTPSGGGR